jgi:hypothetical protein
VANPLHYTLLLMTINIGCIYTFALKLKQSGWVLVSRSVEFRVQLLLILSPSSFSSKVQDCFWPFTTSVLHFQKLYCRAVQTYWTWETYDNFWMFGNRRQTWIGWHRCSSMCLLLIRLFIFSLFDFFLRGAITVQKNRMHLASNSFRRHLYSRITNVTITWNMN